MWITTGGHLHVIIRDLKRGVKNGIRVCYTLQARRRGDCGHDTLCDGHRCSSLDDSHSGVVQ